MIALILSSQLFVLCGAYYYISMLIVLFFEQDVKYVNAIFIIVILLFGRFERCFVIAYCYVISPTMNYPVENSRELCNFYK